MINVGHIIFYFLGICTALLLVLCVSIYLEIAGKNDERHHL